MRYYNECNMGLGHSPVVWKAACLGPLQKGYGDDNMGKCVGYINVLHTAPSVHISRFQRDVLMI